MKRVVNLSGMRLALGAALLAAPSLGGCYEFAPSAAQPTPGERLVFEINDQGRVALSGQLGPGITEVEGRLVSVEGSAYRIAVLGVTSIASGASHWSGERVGIESTYVSRVQERRFSKGKTAVAVASAVGAITAFIVTRQLIGGGGSSPQNPPPPPSGS